MKLYLLFISLVLFSSCVSNDFKIMQSSGNNPGVVLEAKMRRGMFGAGGEFELKLINASAIDLKGCKLEFNDKYNYTLNGLHTEGKGIYKSEVFAKGDTIIIPFTEAVDNFIFFKVPEDGFKPEKIRMTCNDCDVSWHLE